MCDFNVKKKTKVSYCIEISEDTKRQLDQLRAEHDAECERNKDTTHMIGLFNLSFILLSK